MVHFYTKIIYLTGFLIGIFIALHFKRQGSVPKNGPSKNYLEWFRSQGFKRKSVQWDLIRYGNRSFTLESSILYNKVRILCVILVRKSRNVEGITDTWGKHCNQLEFINVTSGEKSILPKKRSYESSSWFLLCKKLTNLKERTVDWILISDDDYFVILENLRYFLAPLNASQTFYFGNIVKFWSTLYNSREGGYVLSYGSLRKMQNHLKNDCNVSNNAFWNKEDLYLGKTLKSLNITPSNTRDLHGNARFIPTSLFHTVEGIGTDAISFRAIEGHKMYTFYYLLYTVQVFFHGNLGNQAYNSRLNQDDVWKKFLKERNINMNVNSEQYYKLWEDLIDDPTSFAKNMKKEYHLDD